MTRFLDCLFFLKYTQPVFRTIFPEIREQGIGINRVWENLILDL
ncbi:hypothetical protein FDUTEX481_08083 [Tolypothrix sp. PCC 7601]|nr:hypothetical protein FDUTEX481_08083 [Tolypothrix sp. PCC 7601]